MTSSMTIDRFLGTTSTSSVTTSTSNEGTEDAEDAMSYCESDSSHFQPEP